jgi:hypothetical protein
MIPCGSSIHVDVHLDRSLRVGHNKVNLAKSPSENDSENNHKPYGELCHNRCICLKIVHSVDLLSAWRFNLALFKIPHMPQAGSLKVLHAPARRGGIRRASQTKIYNLETGE